jgi:hypothetical protein
MLLGMSRKTRKTHIQKTHTRTHTQTQKFLGRHMVQTFIIKYIICIETRMFAMYACMHVFMVMLIYVHTHISHTCIFVFVCVHLYKHTHMQR